jgi:predicted glycoside hydrolase/deacetylase ChbG (UPF0249 family)
MPIPIRTLLVIADDYGIGLRVSDAILELARAGRVTGTALLANAPYAEPAVGAWRRAGMPVEMGWHPNLTLDAPVLPPKRVPSLVQPDGAFWPLSTFLRRCWLGRVNPAEVESELRAQLRQFNDLVGHPPRFVNTHQHISLFQPVAGILERLLRRQRPLPYVRRVREPWATWRRVPGARLKRWVLDRLGRWQSRRLDESGFPGNDWLAGITDPPATDDPQFFTRWLHYMPGDVVELMCHPGADDSALHGRTGETPAMLRRRVRERQLLELPSFLEAVRAAGFQMLSPSAWVAQRRQRAAAA